MSKEPEQYELGFSRPPETAARDDHDLARQAEVAIGEYLGRGRRIWPDMPIARILKALERQGISAQNAPRALELIGAHVTQVPDYVAKFNHRVTFPQAVLDRCRQVYQEEEE